MSHDATPPRRPSVSRDWSCRPMMAGDVKPTFAADRAIGPRSPPVVLPSVHAAVTLTACGRAALFSVRGNRRSGPLVCDWRRLGTGESPQFGHKMQTPTRKEVWPGRLTT